MPSPSFRALLALVPVLLAASASALSLPRWSSASNTSSSPSPSSPSITVTLDPATTYQSVDGFGVSQAFQRAEDVLGKYGLSPAGQARVLELLFSPLAGAGFTLLRNGIGSSNSSESNYMNSIEPFAPTPDAPGGTPRYVWDGYDSGQLPLSQRAMGVAGAGAGGAGTGAGVRVYADAWSAPGYMKTNDDDSNGGYLCGVGNGTKGCATGDWKQAYAEYLLKYVSFYREAGVPVSYLGFLNEPSYKTSYASMLSDGAEAADFVRVLGAAVERAGLAQTLEMTCCDDYGWDEQAALLPGLQSSVADADGTGKTAEDYLSIITAHGYGSAPTYPLPTRKRVWLTEWADLSGDYYPHTFYNASQPADAQGLTWARHIQVAFQQANVSAFLYWIGAENANASSSLITMNGETVTPSKRFWAFASWSRFVRPGAERIDVTIRGDGGGGAPDGMLVTAFVNTDGSTAVQVLNNATETADLTLDFGTCKTLVVPWVTNNEYDLHALPAVPVDAQGRAEVQVPGRSLVSFVA